MTLETTRLRLRPFREDDVQAIYDNSSAPEVGLNAGWKPHESLTESYECCTSCSSTSRRYGRSSGTGTGG